MKSKLWVGEEEQIAKCCFPSLSPPPTHPSPPSGPTMDSSSRGRVDRLKRHETMIFSQVLRKSALTQNFGPMLANPERFRAFWWMVFFSALFLATLIVVSVPLARLFVSELLAVENSLLCFSPSSYSMWQSSISAIACVMCSSSFFPAAVDLHATLEVVPSNLSPLAPICNCGCSTFPHLERLCALSEPLFLKENCRFSMLDRGLCMACLRFFLGRASIAASCLSRPMGGLGYSDPFFLFSNVPRPI